MAAGVGILGVDRGGQSPHDAGEQLGLLSIQLGVAAMDAQDSGDRVEQVGLGGAELAAGRMIEGGQVAKHLPALADRHRLVAYHRAGYAGSGGLAGPLSFGQEAARCRALLRHLGIERAHLVGHSSSGSMALQVALDAADAVPDQVEALLRRVVHAHVADGFRVVLDGFDLMQ